MSRGDFQSQVNTAQAPAVAGDFATKNPRYFYPAGPGGCVAGPAGCLVARFAWATPPLDGDGSPATVTNSGYGLPTGFIHREQQALIVNYLSPAGMEIQPGFGLTITEDADLWMLNEGTTEAVPSMKVYAGLADGKATAAVTGSPTGGGTSTASTISTATATFTADFADDIMTVSGAVTGTIYPGSTVTGTGVPADCVIVSQLTGTPGGDGTYLLTASELALTAVSTTATYGLLTIGGSVAGTFAVNQNVTGSGITAGTYITALGSGTGGAGTYAVNIGQSIGSQAINTATNVETSWNVRSSALPGEVFKASRKTLG
jgi:hypothetical protein